MVTMERNTPTHRTVLGEASISLTGAALLTETEILAGMMPPPLSTGIYFLISGGRVVYVGQSTNVAARVNEHRQTKIFEGWAFVPCQRDQLDVMESLYIHTLRPPWNGITNDKISPSAPLPLRKLCQVAGVQMRPDTSSIPVVPNRRRSLRTPPHQEIRKDTMIRLPVVMEMTGLSRSSIYGHVRDGVFPEPVRIGMRSVAWIAGEVAEIINARVMGSSNDAVRSLVTKLREDRLRASG